MSEKPMPGGPVSTVTQRAADEAASRYNPASNDYDLAKDPRCLFGWGPPECGCVWGHGCFRSFGHPGKCGDPLMVDPLPCERRQRPKDWDAIGRAEANQ